MLLPLVDALKIQAVASCHFMRFQWLDVGNYNLRRGLEHGRDLVEEYQPHLALVDFTGLPPISLVDEMWMSMYWFPRIVRQSLQRVAIVTGPQHLHNQMATEAMFWVARHLIRFQVQFFDEPEAALHWLLEGDPALRPLLLAEWSDPYPLAANLTTE